jgi:hypothetical protein
MFCSNNEQIILYVRTELGQNSEIQYNNINGTDIVN